MCLVMTDVIIVKFFLMSQVKALASEYELTLVCSAGGQEEVRRIGVSARVLNITIPRGIEPYRDCLALFKLLGLFARCRFDIVQSYTTKAGMLAMMAAFLMRVPVRVHWFLGQVWATKTGVYRAMLRLCDVLTSRLATSILVDSASQLAFLVAEGVTSPPKAKVLAHGSICGVDCDRFSADPALRANFREHYAIPPNHFLFLYMSRFTVDKGAMEMAKAYAICAPECPDSTLVMVGPDEEDLLPSIRSVLAKHLDRVHFHGFTSRPEFYFAGADALCLPSFREGFGLVLLNAAASGLPSLGSRIYGIVDAVVDGETGLLHTPGDTEQLAANMIRLYRGRELCRELGRNGRLRAVNLFSSSLLDEAVVRHYRALVTGRS